MACFVLVHGAYHGGWCYARVAGRLRARGHDVHTPTLTGLGERAHLADRPINLSTHIQDIVAAILGEDLNDVILCGHSYGGMVITGVAGQIAELAHRAGIPPGVFNVITGPATVLGAELTSNPVVRKLTFTGSTEVGKKLMAQCVPTLKKLSLELGGNAPFIVFDDADIDKAIEGAMASKYRNAGQTCVCANRLLVQDGIYDAFAVRLAEAARKMKVGAGTESGVLQGPLIDAQALTKVEEHVADALAKGAKVLTGGRRHALGGTFYEPTVIADVTPDMKCAREETFGPVAPLFRFRTEDEAVALANATEFGLAAYFFSRDVARCFRVAEALEYGMVGVNTGIMSNEVAPFGGVKQSGIGREGSKYGIEDYLEIKYLCFGGIA